ncbi:type IV secretory pathway, VirD4 component [Novosphingobium sp. AP12]|nr:type IV secretory pathway, VirD4 component [Novosphingobium sp. AP12]
MTAASDRASRSHALWRMRVRQSQQRFGFFCVLVLVCGLAGALVWSRLLLPGYVWSAAGQSAGARLLLLASPVNGRETAMNVSLAGQRVRLPARVVAHAPPFAGPFDAAARALLLGGVMGAGTGLVVTAAVMRAMARQGRDTLGDRVLGGTRVIMQPGGAPAAAARAAGCLAIGRIVLPRAIETRHFAFLGTTGSGKTTVLRQMLEGIAARGEAALVYDTSGEFIAHYYAPERGDIILNPFDARCASWSPFDEISHPADADRIARQLVSETGSHDDDVWLDTSRILVANMLRSLWSEGNANLEALLEALQTKSKQELKQWLGHTSSARTFADDADRATGSVLFMLAKAANLLQFLRREAEADAPADERGGRGRFAFRDFISGLDAREGPRPWIFVPRKEDYFEAAKPLMACWLECAASAVLGLPPSPGRRIWFVLDELADLPRVDNLARLLPEGRKFGAAIVLTFQALGQMRNRYGPHIAESMLACCNTKLFLQIVDYETRQWASRTIGECEIEIRAASDALPVRGEAGRTTIAAQRSFRPAVPESEFRLPPWHGYLLLPDGAPVVRLVLQGPGAQEGGARRHPAFVPGDPRDTLWSRPPARRPDSGAESGASHDPLV